MRKHRLLVFLGLLLAPIAASKAQLTLQVSNTGLQNTAGSLNFSEVPVGNLASVSDQFASFGVTFQNAWLVSTQITPDAPYISNFQDLRFADPPLVVSVIDLPAYMLTIQFAQPVYEFSWLQATRGIRNYGVVGAFLGEDEIQFVDQTFLGGADSPRERYMVMTGGQFDRITLGVSNFYLSVDNLRFSPTPIIAAVPEPSTWLMLLFGFGWIGYAMRCRRRATTRSSA